MPGASRRKVVVVIRDLIVSLLLSACLCIFAFGEDPARPIASVDVAEASAELRAILPQHVKDISISFLGESLVAVASVDGVG